VPAADLGIEVLQEANACVSAGLGVGAVRGELDEVDRMRDRDRAREVGEKDEARFQGCDEQRLASFVIANDLTTELAYARLQLLAREVDVAEPVSLS